MNQHEFTPQKQAFHAEKNKHSEQSLIRLSSNGTMAILYCYFVPT